MDFISKFVSNELDGSYLRDCKARFCELCDKECQEINEKEIEENDDD